MLGAPGIRPSSPAPPRSCCRTPLRTHTAPASQTLPPPRASAPAPLPPPVPFSESRTQRPPPPDPRPCLSHLQQPHHLLHARDLPQRRPHQQHLALAAGLGGHRRPARQQVIELFLRAGKQFCGVTVTWICNRSQSSRLSACKWDCGSPPAISVARNSTIPCRRPRPALPRPALPAPLLSP